MAERERRDRTGEPIDDQRYPQTGASRSDARCADCLLSDPQARTRHHLRWLMEHGLTSFGDHVTAQFVTLRDPGKKRPDSADSLIVWASNLIAQYAGMAHPDDGHPMPWWEARQWMMEHRHGADTRVRDERKMVHLEHKRLLGARYRPPCIHGAQGDPRWPNSACDPELCNGVFVPVSMPVAPHVTPPLEYLHPLVEGVTSHVSVEPGDNDPLAI